MVVDLTRCARGAADAYVQRYVVSYDDRMSVLSLLRRVYETDPTVAFRTFQCGRGICNTCRVRLNGKILKACSRLVKPGEHLTIEPYSAKRTLRDVAQDLD